MPRPDQPATVTVALVGNPNTGKSTVFGALVGGHQRVGNYPGVTVERKTGRLEIADRSFLVVDLPGLYSLAPRSRDEMVAVDLLLGRQAGQERVDVVLCVVDASNLPRNLYLVSQVLELGLPTVIALNMLDVVRSRGMKLDVEALRRRLPVPMVEIQANRRLGIAELKEALGRVAAGEVAPREAILPKPFHEAADRVAPRLCRCCQSGCPGGRCSRWLAQRLLLDAGGYLEGRLAHGPDEQLARELAAERALLAEKGCAVPDVETTARWEWVRRALDGALLLPTRDEPTASDRLDRVLTHRVWGGLLLGLLMILVFQAVFVWATPAMDLIDQGFAALGRAVRAGLADTSLAGGAIESLLVGGVIAGVGSVLEFLPQILILFFFLAILEDCGYMARAAYLMDRLMARVGLSGTSFIPLLSSFGCAVPGIMAARVIANERDRLTTILIAPLLTCSARLPVYTLLIAAFVPAETYAWGMVSVQGLVLLGLYLLGLAMAVAAAWVLKRTVLRGESSPFFMELPAYHWPTPRVVVHRVVERGWLFVRTAGTMILAVSVLVWAAMYFPRGAEVSLLGRMGRAIEPAVRPLGWDWRIGCAVLASLPAREAVVATLGVTFSAGEAVKDQGGAESEENEPATLASRLGEATWEGTDRPLFTLPTALSILVFFALCVQCSATLAVIRRETNSWRWPLFVFGYMTALAYLGALATYQLGTWLAGA